MTTAARSDRVRSRNNLDERLMMTTRHVARARARLMPAHPDGDNDDQYDQVETMRTSAQATRCDAHHSATAHGLTPLRSNGGGGERRSRRPARHAIFTYDHHSTTKIVVLMAALLPCRHQFNSNWRSMTIDDDTTGQQVGKNAPTVPTPTPGGKG